MCVVSPVSARHVVSVAENDGHFTFYTVYTPRRPGCRPPLGAPGAGVCCIVMRIQNGGVRSAQAGPGVQTLQRALYRGAGGNEGKGLKLCC